MFQISFRTPNDQQNHPIHSREQINGQDWTYRAKVTEIKKYNHFPKISYFIFNKNILSEYFFFQIDKKPYENPYM